MTKMEYQVSVSTYLLIKNISIGFWFLWIWIYQFSFKQSQGSLWENPPGSFLWLRHNDIQSLPVVPGSQCGLHGPGHGTIVASSRSDKQHFPLLTALRQPPLDHREKCLWIQTRAYGISLQKTIWERLHHLTALEGLPQAAGLRKAPNLEKRGAKPRTDLLGL